MTPAQYNQQKREAEWKVLPQRKNDSDIWIPVELRRRNTRANEDLARYRSLAHDLAVSDVYAVLFPHVYEDGERILEFWDRDKSTPLYDRLRYDADAKIFGKHCFLEVERRSHPILTDEFIKRHGKQGDSWTNSLNYKLDRYVKYAEQEKKKFQVLITLEDCTDDEYDPEGTEDYFKRAQSLVEGYQRNGHTFLIAPHRDVVGDKNKVPGEIHHEVLGDPLGPVWYSPAANAYVSLADVETHV